MNAVTERLIASKALIADPANWIQQAFSKEVDGRACFCSAGALFKNSDNNVAFDVVQGKAYRLLNKAATIIATGAMLVVEFNDTRTHAEVMEMWDLAIELSKEEA